MALEGGSFGSLWPLWYVPLLSFRFSAAPDLLSRFQIAESVISLLPIVISSTSKLLSHRSQRAQSKLFQAANERGTDYVDYSDEDEELDDETPDRLVPMSWVWVGLGASGVGGVAIVWALFGSETIKPWATGIGFVLACLLSLLG